MNAKRSLWVFGLLAAVAVAGGCNKDESKPSGTPGGGGTPASPSTPPATQPSSPATAPSTQPSAANPAAPLPGSALAAAEGGAALAAAAGAAPSGQGPSGGIEEVPASAPAPQADPKKVPQAARVPGWYQWRGPEQTGVSREKNLPEKWDPNTGENLVWTADVGGMSSPVVWNGKLYTFTRAGEVQDVGNLVPGPRTQEALTCVDIKNGKVLWQHTENMTQTEVPFHRLGWSSPCVDPSTGRVYAIGSQCTLLCLDGDSDKVVWKRQMTEEFGMISTFGGRTPSPTIDEDQVFVAEVSFGWGDHAGAQDRIFALNKNTGELNWSAGTGGIPVDAPQNTPVVAVVNGQRLVIFASGDGSIDAFQARTGKPVWRYRASKRGINTSVVVDGTRLYCSHGLENFDTSTLGRVFCLDLTKVENGAPKEVWRITGDEAAFPTSCVTDKWVYVVDDKARLYQIDKLTGKVAWKKAVGRIGKPSPVWGDGKIYAADGNGTFTIIKPGDTQAEVLSKVDLPEKLGREYAMYGSPAIADGRVYVQTATKIYCIGNKDQTTQSAAPEIPPMPEENPAETKAAQLLVLPGDVALHAGQEARFHVKAYDANGRELKDVPADQVKWAIGELTLPPPPRPPAMPKPETPAAGAGDRTGAAAPGAERGTGAAPGGAAAPATAGGAAAKAESSDAARNQLAAAAATQPAVVAATTGPAKVGNLAGQVDANGVFHSKAGPPQGGAIDATYEGITNHARARVFPPLPWKIDFESAPVDKPPLTWLGAGGKYAVVQDPDNPGNKVLQKLMNIDLYYRARTNYGTVDMSNYTVQADAKVNEKQAGGRRYVPSASVLNSRYVLILDGMSQRLQIHVWPSALPDERNPHGSLHSDLPFAFEAHKWYRLKLQVTPEGNKAVARGKCWPADGQEPKDWMLTLEDPIPNLHGNPGLFTVSLVGDFKSEVYYDNILVTPNGTPSAQATPEEVNK